MSLQILCKESVIKELNESIHNSSKDILNEKSDSVSFIDQANMIIELNQNVSKSGRYPEECNWMHSKCLCANKMVHFARITHTPEVVATLDRIFIKDKKKLLKIRIQDLRLLEFYLEIDIEVNSIVKMIQEQ